MKNISRIISFLVSAIFSFAVGLVGNYIMKEFPQNWWFGIGFWVLAFLGLYFSYYILEIREHKKSLIDLKKELKQIQDEAELNKKVLNTIKEIIWLDKIKQDKIKANE